MHKGPMHLLDSYMRYKGQNMEDFLVSMIRGFNPNDPNFLQKFRIQPNAALLKVIYFATSSYNEAVHVKRVKNHDLLARELNKSGVFIPGAKNIGNRSFWLFPVMVPNKEQFLDFSIANGLMATAGRTQTKVVPVPKSRVSETNPAYEGNAKMTWALSHVVYLPCHEFLTEKEVQTIAKRFIDIYTNYNAYCNHLKELKDNSKSPVFTTVPGSNALSLAKL